MNTATLVTGLFVDPLDAHRSVALLIEAGIPRDDLSLIAPAPPAAPDGHAPVGESAAIGAGVGGALGALLAGFGGLGALVIGGAPVLAAGPILAVLAGAGAGAAGGGVLGGLIGLGIPEEDVDQYTRGFEKGSVLLAVRCSPQRESLVRDILRQFNATRLTSSPAPSEEPLGAEAWGSQGPLHRLFIDQLGDIYYAERQLERLLGAMSEHAASPELVAALDGHRGETKTHIARVESVFAMIGVRPAEKRCPVINGLISEAAEMLAMEGADPAKDAAIICAAQKAEHYEIGTYGCLRTYARTLSLPEAADLLDLTLAEEWTADRRLTEIATSGVNADAVA